jgi:hypothetical protein
MLGWLASVIVAFALGSAAGKVQLKSLETENGQSRLADETEAPGRGDRSRRSHVEHPVGGGDPLPACSRKRRTDLQERSRGAGDRPDTRSIAMERAPARRRPL